MKATNAAQPPAGQAGLATMRAAFAALAGICYPAMLLFRGNMRVRQRRAWAGYLWLVLPGVAITIAFSLLRHGSLFVVGPMALPYPLFALSGVFLWQCFTDGLTGPLQALNRERYFLSVNAAPHGAILLAGVLESLLALGVRMALLLAAMLAFQVAASSFWLLIPFAALIIFLFGLGCGMLVAPVGQFYDDVGALIGIASGFGLFLVPAIYPIPATSLLAWNPLVAVVDAAHAWMVGAPAPQLPVLAVALAVALLPLGWLAVTLARPHIAARAG